MKSHLLKSLLRKWITPLIVCFTLVNAPHVRAQVNTGGNASTADHQKEIIGYITNWDAWKSSAAGVPSAGALTHLNIDYSKYTILNYSFFGVAVDGSLHSGDLRNKNIHQEGQVQQPADIFFTSIYDSWDMLLLFGEIEAVHYISEDIKTRAEAQGFVVEVNSNTWEHPDWGLSGTLPLPLHKEDGAPGVLELARQNNVKVMASIGGWSMCKHFPEMAADPQKRATFIADCQKLINTGFDGIDLDWEYPGPYAGMNFTGSQADFANFLTLVQELRAAIGPDKLITAAFSADPVKVQGFNWSSLSATMDYFNFMTYDFNGGWSDIAGHNSPLYPYDGAEAPDFNWQSTLNALTSLGVPKNKINFGMPFYGRGVITDGSAGLNISTQKRNETVQPDGPIVTCADFVNWPRDVYDGTPNYFFIQQAMNAGGWTRHWDDQAKVPYLTKGNYFLSYDDEESITHKSQFIVDNDLAGAIVWTVYGDLEFSGSPESFGTKLKRWPSMSSPLINTVNEAFAGEGSPLPTTRITSPESGTAFEAGENITIEATASGGPITKVEFFNGEEKLGEDTETPYSFTWNNIPAGSHNIKVVATSDAGTTVSSESISITASTDSACPDDFRIVGYMPSWAGTAAEIQYDKLTHIIYAFINPQASGDGSLTAIENPAKLQQIVSSAHTNGVKVMIAVGGWTDLNNPGFETLSANATSRQNFADNLLNLVNQYNLDGVDIDWEYPREGNEPQNYAAMMQKLGEVMHSNGKLLTAAVAAVGYYADGILDSVFPHIDFLNLMAYDGGSGSTHSPYSYAVQTLDYWLGRGLPASKAVLGVPFYARPSWSSYRNLVASGADPNSDTYNGDYYNGLTTIRQKTQLAAERASGIMIWELSQDTNDNIAISLLNAIHDEAPDNCQGNGGNPSIFFTSPANGSTVTTGEPVTLSVNANDDGSITSVVFEVNGQTLTASGTQGSYAASWTPPSDGTYTIIATVTDNEGNTASAQLTLTAGSLSGCSAPAWGANSIYVADDQVSHNGGLYRAKWWTQNENPETHSAEWDVWEYLGPCNSASIAFGKEMSPAVLYPNPFSGTATLEVNLKESGNTKILMYNNSGRLIRNVSEGDLRKGRNEITIEGSSLPRGAYYLKIYSPDNKSITIPVIKN
ncbi:glycosyl hydrolase family 18 protein [Sinomicrobium sp. M5D2P17]